MCVLDLDAFFTAFLALCHPSPPPQTSSNTRHKLNKIAANACKFWEINTEPAFLLTAQVIERRYSRKKKRTACIQLTQQRYKR